MKKYTLNKWMGILCMAILVVCTVIAFFTNYWLAADDLTYGAKFKNLGLWVHCFRSLEDPLLPNKQRYFVGCRWMFEPFTRGYSDIRGYLVPPFFIAVQFFYTVGFILMLVASAAFLMLILCFGKDDRQVKLLKVLTFSLLAAGLCGVIAVITFGARGAKKGWMPRSEYNFLSWSYGLAVTGTVFELIAALLFYTEAGIQRRKIIVRDRGNEYAIEQQQKL